LRLIVFPVVLGEGKRLFGDGTVPRTWKLTSSKSSSTGAIIATYERAGEVETGYVGPEQE
jgi:dihydrofolate reductase